MRDKSSSPEKAGPVWHQAQIWWPIECVPLTLEIAHPRKLTALEWAVLRVVDQFRDAPPSLHEVAYQLGIEDPSFLVDAVKEAVRLRALAPRQENVSPRDLPDLDFTPLGFELYQRGQIEAEPAEHGETLYFDALTDEALPAPKALENWAERPFPRAQADLEARVTVGLDRAREIVRRLHPDLLRGDGEVRSVVPQEDDWPRVAWHPIELELRVDDAGSILVKSRGLSAAGQAFLLASDLVDEGVLPTAAVSEHWESEGAPRCSSGLSFEDWRALTARTLPVNLVQAEVMRLLGQVRDEVIVQSIWLAVPDVRARLFALASEGRRVLVAGSPETECFAFAERPRPGLAVGVQVGTPVVGALVIDGRTGVLLDDVEVQLQAGHATIELAGVLSREGAHRCRAAMVGELVRGLRVTPKGAASPIRLDPHSSPQAQADRALEDPELRLALGALAARQDAAGYDLVVGIAERLTSGLDRVALLARVATVGRSFAPELAPGALTAPVISAWRASVSLLSDTDEGIECATLLARLAPEGVEAEELVAAALQAGARQRGRGTVQFAGQFLADLRVAVDSRWGRGTAASSRIWTDARDRLMEPSRWSLASLSQAVEVSGLLFAKKEQDRWAAALINVLPEPATAQEFRSWLEGIAPLRELAPDVVEEVTARAWVDLVEAWPKQRTELVRLAQGAVSHEVVSGHLLQDARSLREVEAVRRQVAAAGFAEDATWWRQRFEQLLPEPAAVHTTGMVEGLVSELAALAPGTASDGLGQAWAARVADQLPAPTTPEGIPWWLNELVPLRPLLSGAEQRAGKAVRPFQRQLGAAKARGDSLWFDCLRAWKELGVPEGALDALVDGPSGGSQPSGGTSKSAKKRKKGKKR